MRAWVDQWPVKVPIYHGGFNLCATHSVVCSNKPPLEYYTSASDVDRSALFARFSFYKATGDGREAERLSTNTFLMKYKYDSEARILVPVWGMPRSAGCDNADCQLFEE